MLLRIEKDQRKGFTGKATFELRPKLILTEEETRLVNHYGLQSQPLTSQKMVGMFGKPKEGEWVVTVSRLLTGDIYKCTSLAEVIDYRRNLIEACKNLKGFLFAAATFEGTEEIDIDVLLGGVSEGEAESS